MATKSFIKTIGGKGLLADYNTEGKKLQTELTAGDNITIDGNTISSDQVFVATYGTTTYQEIKDAYDAGKICMVFNEQQYCCYIAEITADRIRFFTTGTGPKIHLASVDRSNHWATFEQVLQRKLTFDTTPTAGSKNPVTSDGIKTALDSRVPFPTSTTGTTDSNAYIVTDSDVVRIKDLATSITSFRMGDVIPVDGPSGTAKMSKDDLLLVTAENALDSIHSLNDTATKDDLKAKNYLALDGSEGAKKLPANIIFPILGNTYSLGIADANDAGVGVLLINTTISHLPESSGILCTYGTSSTSNYLTQLYIATQTNNLYTRSKHNGSWRAWKKYDLKGYDATPELSIFETFGVIGDSYASGVIYNSAGTDSSTFYNKSWAQILGRKNGINVTNYSFGGARTNTWLTNATYGLAKLLSDPALDAYAIVLSINDRNNGGAEWLGTIDDIHIGDPSLNADSFYGCYAKIIENILSHAPNAKIFCVQHAYNEKGLPKDYNDAISAIARLYNLPCVPEFEDEFFSSEIYTQMYGGHPTYVGYAGMADALCRLFRKAMVAYKDYFKQYVPIP